MRTITTINLRPEGAARADAVARHLRGDDHTLDGAELAEMLEELPADVRTARGSRIPAPDSEAIHRVLARRGLQPGGARFAQAADALSLMCQATPGELHTDRIIGAFSISVGANGANGILSRGPSPAVLQIRLRGSTTVIYDATEHLIREIARVDERIAAADVVAIAKERESDEVLERADMDLIRRRSTIGVLSSAARQRMIDPALLSFAFIVVAGVALSWLIHFHPAALGMSRWKADDINWIDGWIGRLASAATFGLITALGFLVSTIRRAVGGSDGVYVSLRWHRAAR